MRIKALRPQLLATLAITCFAAACGGKADRPPVVTSGPDRPPATTTVPQQVAVERNDDFDNVRNDGLNVMDPSDPLGVMGLQVEDLNARQPLADIRFDYDSSLLSAQARTTLDSHAALLKTYSTWSILIEGHCDERGTVEYNLALGERRADSVLNYLASLGIHPSRLRTISYGKEFPLNPGHNESAWSQNRRGHFEIASK